MGAFFCLKACSVIEMKNKYFEKLLVFSVTLTVCFIFLEAGLRITGHRAFNISVGEYRQYGRSYRLKKNSTKFHNWSTSSFAVKTNSLGLRDKVAGERDLGDRPYVLFLGDSQTFGLGCDYEKTFVGVFADYAAGRGIEVLNLAVGGHFLLEQEELFKDMLKVLPKKPSMVFYTFNPSSLNNFDNVHNSVVVKSGYLFYESTWKSAYVRMMLQNNLSIYVFFRDILWSLYRSWGGSDDKVRLPRHFNLYSKNSKLYDADITSRLEDYLNSFQSYCDEIGIRTVYLYLPIVNSFTIKEAVTQLGRDPGEYDVSLYERYTEDFCTRHGHLFLNPKPLLKEYYDQGVVLDLVRDLHYNEFSNRVVGEYLIEKVFIEHELF